MPTVCRQKGHRVVIYSQDHRPAHVHVIKDGLEAVFQLQCPGGPPTLRENYGFARHELGVIAEALNDCLSSLCGEWSKIHGPY